MESEEAQIYCCYLDFCNAPFCPQGSSQDTDEKALLVKNRGPFHSWDIEILNIWLDFLLQYNDRSLEDRITFHIPGRQWMSAINSELWLEPTGKQFATVPTEMLVQENKKHLTTKVWNYCFIPIFMPNIDIATNDPIWPRWYQNCLYDDLKQLILPIPIPGTYSRYWYQHWDFKPCSQF